MIILVGFGGLQAQMHLYGIHVYRACKSLGAFTAKANSYKTASIALNGIFWMLTPQDKYDKRVNI